MADEKGLITLLQSRQDEIRVQIPSWINPERFMQSAHELHRLWLRDDNLRKCTNESLVNCIYESARTGLEFASKHAYCVAYGDQATFLPGYRGKIFLALRSGAVTTIQTDVVYQNDHFAIERNSANPQVATLIHRINIAGDRGKVIGAYAIAKLTTGEVDFEYCTKDRIERSRRKSKQPNGLLWSEFYEEGAKKTAVHLLCKRLPEGMNAEVMNAIHRARSLEIISGNPEDDGDPGELKEHERPTAAEAVNETTGELVQGEPYPPADPEPPPAADKTTRTLTPGEIRKLEEHQAKLGLTALGLMPLFKKYGVWSLEELNAAQLPQFVDDMKRVAPTR